MIVLDTNVVSELMKPAPSASVVSWLERQAADDVTTTAVTVGEIRYGIARLPQGRRKTELLAAADRTFQGFSEIILAFDEPSAAHYSEVVVTRARKGEPISGFDAQIAAICRANRSPLATRNVADFAHLDLTLHDPWDESG